MEGWSIAGITAAGVAIGVYLWFAARGARAHGVRRREAEIARRIAEVESLLSASGGREARLRKLRSALQGLEELQEIAPGRPDLEATIRRASAVLTEREREPPRAT